METILTGVAVGSVMVVVNAIAGALMRARRQNRSESQSLAEHTRRIAALEAKAQETKELAKLTLCLCVIIGDGMMQSGLNGSFKKAFCKKKQEALKML